MGCVQFREHSFIRKFPDLLASELEASAVIRLCPDGEVLFEEAEPADSVYLVLEGLVELSKHGEAGAPVLASVRSDGYMGEVGILSGLGRTARAVCRGPETRVARIPKEAFLEVIQRAPVSCVLDLIGKLGENLREMDERYVRDVLRKERLSLIGEMANKVIHDLKAPFTALSMGVEMIERMHADPATARFCRVMHRNLQLVQQMMQEILDFTSGRARLNRAPVAVGSILSDLVEDNQHWLEDQRVGISVEGADVLIDVDAGRVRRALQNLVVNAVDAFKRGEGNRIFVTVKPLPDSGFAEVLFEDNGPGLPPQLGASVLDPFVTSGKKGGTGLGLSIVRSIILAHGGSITVGNRTTGTGASFRILLPLAGSAGGASSPA